MHGITEELAKLLIGPNFSLHAPFRHHTAQKGILLERLGHRTRLRGFRTPYIPSRSSSLFFYGMATSLLYPLSY